MATVNTLLQEVNNALGPEENELEKLRHMKLRFPRGYIRTAEYFRFRLACVKDETTKSNIAYQLMLSDVFSWLLNRTDVFGPTKGMIIKYEIAIMSSIAETLLVIFSPKNKKTFKERLKYLTQNDKVSRDTAKEIWWLWGFRNGIHLFELIAKEHNKYDETHFDKAVIGVRTLIDELEAKCN